MLVDEDPALFLSPRLLLLVLLLLLFLLYVTLSRNAASRGKLPPSPPTLPIVGNAIAMIKELKKGKNPYEVFSQLAE